MANRTKTNGNENDAPKTPTSNVPALQEALPGTLPGLPAALAGRVVNLADTGLDQDKLYTMDETANRAVYITSYEVQDGENGQWHIWHAYAEGLGDGGEIRIAGGGSRIMPMVETFFENNPDGVLGIGYVKVYTKSGRPFWRAVDPRELFAYNASVQVEDVTAKGDIPF